MTVALVFAAVCVPMIVEALIASRHDRILQGRGAVEPADDVLGRMRLAYPGAFLLMLVEGWLRQAPLDGVFWSGAMIFGAAKALKWWAMATLGERWTFRVLVPPDSTLVTSGPYRWMRHPNYVAVIGELAGAAVICHALFTGPLVTLAFLELIRRRIIVEERSLGAPPAQTPLWARIADGVALALLGTLLWKVASDDTRAGVFDYLPRWPPDVVLYALAAVLVVRHLGVARPTTFARWRTAWLRVTAAPAWGPAVRAFLATRVFIFVVALIAVATIEPKSGGVTLTTDQLSSLSMRFDAGWYGGIATYGYDRQIDKSRQRNTAFFPAFPLLMRTVGPLFGTTAPVSKERRMARMLWSGIFVSLVAFLGALYYLVRFGSDLLGAERGANAALLLATYPFAVFYSAPYTEALFLLTSVAASYHFTRGEWGRSAAWGLVLGLTRPNGFFLSVPLGLLVLARALARDRPSWGELSKAALAAIAPTAGMLVFSVYLYSFTRIWFAWSLSQEAWGRRFTGLEPVAEGLAWLRRDGVIDVLMASPYNLVNSLAAAFALLMVWPVARRIGIVWAIYVLAMLLPPILAGGALSLGRITAPLFPVFLALAAVVPARSAPAWAAAFALGQGLVATIFYTWRDLY